MDNLQPLVAKWLELDEDGTSRSEIETLVGHQDHIELESRLRSRISFGTAGLRAAMKAGFAYMNSVTVLQASQGLAEYVQSQSELHNGERLKPLSIVIGHDARHNSTKFARLTAATFVVKGFEVR